MLKLYKSHLNLFLKYLMAAPRLQWNQFWLYKVPHCCYGIMHALQAIVKYCCQLNFDEMNFADGSGWLCLDAFPNHMMKIMSSSSWCTPSVQLVDSHPASEWAACWKLRYARVSCSGTRSYCAISTFLLQVAMYGFIKLMYVPFLLIETKTKRRGNRQGCTRQVSWRCVKHFYSTQMSNCLHKSHLTFLVPDMDCKNSTGIAVALLWLYVAEQKGAI